MSAVSRVAKAASTAFSRERVMVLNCGSSSIKFQVVVMLHGHGGGANLLMVFKYGSFKSQVIEMGAGKPVLAGQADRLNTEHKLLIDS